jgi:hypothetical protein
VKVAVASIPADLINLVNGGRPFTTMYVINFSSKAKIDMKTLIHELAHVHQGVVDGPVYMIQAIEAQLGKEGYTVTNAMLRDRGNDLKKFNREQQAVIAEEFWYEEFGQHEAAYRSLPSDGLDVNLLRPYAQQFKSTQPIVRFPVRPLPIPTIPAIKLPRLSPIRAPAMEAARVARRPSSRGKASRRPKEVKHSTLTPSLSRWERGSGTQALRLNRFIAVASPSRAHASAMSEARPMCSSSCRRSPSSKFEST